MSTKNTSEKPAKKPSKPDTKTPSKEKLAKEKEAADKQKAKDEEQASKRGNTIALAGKKGEQIANALAHDMVGNLSQATKGKFVLDGVSMKLVKGFKPTEADFAEVMGCLLNLKGAASNAADAAGFYLADAIILAKQVGFDGDQLVEQVADEFGVEKYTAMRAQALGEAFPPEKRILGSNGKLLNMTTHKEIMDGSGAVKDKSKIEEIIRKVAEGKTVGTVKKGNTEMPIVKPYSTKEVRAMMDEAAGSKPKIKPGKGGTEVPSGGFIYLTKDANEYDTLYLSKDLSLKACSSPEFIVLDLLTMMVLDNKGNPESRVEQLSDEWFDEPKLEIVKPNKTPNSKKEKTPATPTPEPEPGPILEPVGATEDDSMPPV